jgi:hypothetical protein
MHHYKIKILCESNTRKGKRGVFGFLFSLSCFVFHLTYTPIEGGDGPYHTDSLAQEGFPLILWEVLQEAGYHAPPQYTVQLFEEHGVPCCKVWLA